MIKIDIFSGFLGAGKTTLIKKLIKEAYHGEKLVLIENEFGEIGIDGGFMKEAGIEVKFYSAKPELNSELETKYKNFFAIGDGAGVTRGLAQAAATGVYVARNILKR